MFAKLLAELKRIAILLQSKKLVDKDYNPDEGGDDKVSNITTITALDFHDLTKQMITGVNYDFKAPNYSQINAPCLASDLFTTEAINAINDAIALFKHLENIHHIQKFDCYIGDSIQINTNTYQVGIESAPNFEIGHASNNIYINIETKGIVAYLDYTSGILEENTQFVLPTSE